MSGADIGIALATGLLAGAAAGLLGVGGGFLMVPAMVVLLGEPQHVAQGTSLLVIVPTTAVGTLVNVRRANLDVSVAWRLGIAGMVGAIVGALSSLQIDEHTLRRIFGVALILISARMLIRRRPRPEDPPPGLVDGT